MLFTIGITIIIAGSAIANPVIICAGLFVCMSANEKNKRSYD